jgi:hypothetical protein
MDSMGGEAGFCASIRGCARKNIHIVDVPIWDPNTRTYDSPDQFEIHLDRFSPSLKWSTA